MSNVVRVSVKKRENISRRKRMDLILTVVLFFKTICIFDFMYIHMYNIHIIEFDFT